MPISKWHRMVCLYGAGPVILCGQPARHCATAEVVLRAAAPGTAQLRGRGEHSGPDSDGATCAGGGVASGPGAAAAAVAAVVMVACDRKDYLQRATDSLLAAHARHPSYKCVPYCPCFLPQYRPGCSRCTGTNGTIASNPKTLKTLNPRWLTSLSRAFIARLSFPRTAAVVACCWSIACGHRRSPSHAADVRRPALHWWCHWPRRRRH